MAFEGFWQTLLDGLDELPDDATFITPRTQNHFWVVNVQKPRIVVQVEDEPDTQPLKRTQFETIYERIIESPGGFELEALPPDADPYPAIFSVHPEFEIVEESGELVGNDDATSSQRIENDRSNSIE